ncbi:MAG: CHASE2 domain-containing protein [Ottowia sp.]|nr:CHASE2 domain-containing protein [Ottowia sp.]
MERFRQFGRGVLQAPGALWALVKRLGRGVLRVLGAFWALVKCLGRGVLQAFEALWAFVKRLWERPFWRAFVAAMAMEVVVSLLGRVGPGQWVENYALDKAMGLVANIGRSDRRPVQLFIDVDERTWRSPAWGGGEPKTVPLEQVASLIERAAQLKSRYVLVDFLIEGERDAGQEAFLARMEGVLGQYRESSLLFVRSFRRPLEEYSAQGIRPSYAVDTLMAKYPQRVFAVAPNFESSDGQMLRHWRLWESACYPLPGNELGEGVWAVVPSPQLMIRALEKKRVGDEDWDVPWRLRFGKAEGTALVTPVAPERGGRCVVDAPEPQPTVNETLEDFSARRAAWEDGRAGSYSARLADWQAGVWVQRLYNTCYQQGFFTDKDCKRGTPPQPRLLREEDGEAAYASGYLANRVLFRHPDWQERNKKAIASGAKRIRPKYHRIAAAELLCAGALPCQSRGIAAEKLRNDLAQFKKAAGVKPLTVAVIGASYDTSHDHHLTPIGRMPGPLVLVNAVDSLQTVDILQDMPWQKSAAIAVVSAFVGAASVARFPAFFAKAFMRVLVPLLIALLSLWLIRRGFWLNASAPFIGIYLERELEIFMEKRKLKEISAHQKEHT